MTRKHIYPAQCHRCGGDAICKECGKVVFGATSFSLWLRELKGILSSRRITNQNLDYIWYNYRQHWFLTLEEKRYGGRCTSTQRTTHRIVAQMLDIASGSKVDVRCFRHTPKLRRVEYRGHYIVRFSETSPEDSKRIIVSSNGEERDVSKNQLKAFLASGRLRTDR